MIDATQLPRLPTRAVSDDGEQIPSIPSETASRDQAKKMELKAGRYYAVDEEN